MSYSDTITYNSSPSLNFDSTKVQITGGTLQLLASGGNYPLTNPEVTSQYAQMISSLTGFTESSTLPSGTSITYQVVLNGVAYWYSSVLGKWTLATDGFSMSNSAAVINTNASTLFTSLNLLVSQYMSLNIFLNTTNATNTPVLTSNTISSSWVNGNPAIISQCLLFGYLSDLLGNQPVPTAAQPINFVVSAEQAFLHGSRFVLPFSKSVAFNSSGYAQVSVIETTTPGIYLTFGYTYYDGNSIATAKLFNAIVPNTPTCAINNLSAIQKYNFG